MKIFSYEKDVFICGSCGKWNKNISCSRCDNSTIFKNRRAHITYCFNPFSISFCKNVKLYLPYAQPTRAYRQMCELFRYLRRCERNDVRSLRDSYRVGSKAIFFAMKQLRDSYWESSEDKGVWFRLGRRG